MAYGQISSRTTNTINSSRNNDSTCRTIHRKADAVSYTLPSSSSSSSSSILNCIVAQIVCLMLLVTALHLCVHMPHGAEAVPLFSNTALNVEYRRYCSTRLSNMIDLICGGNTNTLGRRFPDSVITGSSRALRRFAPDDDVFYRPTHSGPIHECCRRPCGYMELRMYCADP